MYSPKSRAYVCMHKVWRDFTIQIGDFRQAVHFYSRYLYFYLAAQLTSLNQAGTAGSLFAPAFQPYLGEIYISFYINFTVKHNDEQKVKW